MLYLLTAMGLLGAAFIAGDGDDQIVGTQDDDAVDAGAGDDQVQGHGGDDLIQGGSGNDVLDGGTGNDSLVGDRGEDTLQGGEGHDVLQGGDGSDLLSGGDQNDSLYGSAGADTLIGGAGLDLLNGGGGDDILRGDFGDTLIGGGGDDQLLVGGEADSGQAGVLRGGNGDDLLVAPSVNAGVVRADAGDDVIVLSGGAEAQGDAGADHFLIDTTLDADEATGVIRDYTPGEDVVGLVFDPAEVSLDQIDVSITDYLNAEGAQAGVLVEFTGIDGAVLGRALLADPGLSAEDISADDIVLSEQSSDAYWQALLDAKASAAVDSAA
ncbi:calcium-binding protein [Thalassobius sp. Cn5-15]|uniref:calcium-binding protein n=1 Tax=Thalassobius sp. Cn5-15 TaxID=2917763 RepID=UPI001EF37420|nr:calcium-binding protein [Thalassobius sp. Cn5-15]MCG7494800.1 calcium-binding protein [Thalassobius sp. Cn5-15]